MRRAKNRTVGGRVATTAMVATAVLAVMGCTNPNDPKGFIDPTAVGRWGGQPLIVPVLDKLDIGIEIPNTQFASATDPLPEDLVAAPADYRIGPNDIVSVTITDLVASGVETVKTARISESGNLSLPLVGQVSAQGKTESEMEAAISAAYRDANLIQQAQVSVTVVEARGRVFSVLGSVGRPNEYPIVGANFRVLDALVLAGDVAIGSEFLYIIREPVAAAEPSSPASPRPRDRRSRHHPRPLRPHRNPRRRR